LNHRIRIAFEETGGMIFDGAAEADESHLFGFWPIFAAGCNPARMSAQPILGRG
jgi:hypothetical protein